MERWKKLKLVPLKLLLTLTRDALCIFLYQTNLMLCLNTMAEDDDNDDNNNDN